VAIYDDMLEIISPGPLPDALPVEELGTGRSEIRNRVLAPIFKEINLIEARGSGIQKMRQELADYPEIELVLKEASHVFQVQFIKQGATQQPGANSRRDQVGTQIEWPEGNQASGFGGYKYDAFVKNPNCHPSSRQGGTRDLFVKRNV
jgi:predicted HTH transcriptional regulator